MKSMRQKVLGFTSNRVSVDIGVYTGSPQNSLLQERRKRACKFFESGPMEVKVSKKAGINRLPTRRKGE